jgi:hypothetical protein
MALTALNIAICIIAIARNVRPGLIGGGAPIGWTVLTPISSQSVITLADAVTGCAPASKATSASSPRCCVMISSPVVSPKPAFARLTAYCGSDCAQSEI